jgi:conjugative relaxase-like TrwC/TraI family protein
MLSVASVKSASGAAEYFAKDDKHPADYYVGDDGSGGAGGEGGPGGGSGEGGAGKGGDTGRSGAANTERTGWEGKGAELLGLSGEVTKDAFEKILNGELPNGDKIGQVQNRQSGIDLTFSMPKSASILALVSGDQRILTAHWNAVRETMSWVEGKFAEGRTYERTKSGEPVRTGNLVYAMFAHDTSRALDPQGHIHVVIANLTRMANGAWQALHNGQLWKNNAVIGAAYHAAFREKLAELGYQTRITGKHGQFEINGVPKEAIDEFSKRRAEILARSEKLGLTSTESLRSITKNSRDPKLNVEDRDKLAAEWRERAAAIGFDGKQVIDDAKARAGQKGTDHLPTTAERVRETISNIVSAIGEVFRPQDPLVSQGLERLRLSPDALRTQAAVASAIRILEQREAAFPSAQITKTALDLGLKGVTAEKADARVEQLLESAKLIPGQSNRIDGAIIHVTTPQALATESLILAQIDKGRGAATPIVAPDAAVERINAVSGDKQLNTGQMAAAVLGLSSTDRIVAVQGVAGAGKSTMIAALARVAEQEGHKVLGLAFQNKMVGDLRDGAGIEAQTVSSFVNTYAKSALAGTGERYEAARGELKGTVLVLDEASMVGSEPMKHLVGIANTLGVEKLIMIGDRQQLSSIDAGKAFAMAQADGIAMVRMDENLRQRTDQLRMIAALANRGEVRGALEVMGDKLKASPDHIKSAADQWLALPKDERERTMVFASGRDARSELNQRIQAGLGAEGTLGEESITLSVLERVNSTREELRYPQTYRAGQTLEVARAVSEIGLRRGSYEVLGIDAKGRVELKVGSRTVRFDPQKIDPLDKRDALGLTQRTAVKIHENDQIRWTANDKDRGLYNAALAQVTGVSKDGISVKTPDDQTHQLKRGDPMLERLGLAYALNMHMAQGVTTDKAIAVMSGSESNLSNQRLFNVTVTRVRDDLTLHTDNKDRLISAIERNEGNKTSALETVGRLEIDGPRDSGAGMRRADKTFNPKVPADLVKSDSMDLSKLRIAVEPRVPDKPFPEKDISLEI